MKKWLWIAGSSLMICLIGGIMLWKMVEAIKFATDIQNAIEISPQTIIQLLTTNAGEIKKTNGKTNIVILGYGGGDHDGPDLTDTMLVFSLDAASGSSALISLPRDIWSAGLQDKLNSAYHYGEQVKVGGGLTLARSTIEDLIGAPMHYAISMDFAKFIKVIDALGGIDVDVQASFTDKEYPIKGKENDECEGDPEYKCRYETLNFTKGMTHMDGALALKFVRSRHAEGDEGSDFARGKRQQDVIKAIKNKVMSMEILKNPSKAFDLFTLVKQSIVTDIKPEELVVLGKIGIKTNMDTVKRISFEQMLITPPAENYGGRFVLTPETSWETIQIFLKQQIGW